MIRDARLPDRFWDKVRDGEGGCWLWLAGKSRDGYGYFWWAPKTVRAHRLAYELLIGPIPDGLEIDHLCRVRACVNPRHLEVVDHRVNTNRGQTLAAANVAKTHCPRGHPLTGENLRMEGRKRRCVTCRRATVLAAVNRLNARKRELADPSRGDGLTLLPDPSS